MSCRRAARSIAVSIFALTADDAARVCAVAEGYDRADSYSRKPDAWRSYPSLRAAAFRFGIPRADQLEFFDDSEYARLFFDSVKRLEQLGGQCVEIDFTPFRAAARLLYDGAWIAERYDAVGEFIERKPESVHPVTRQLILASGALTAAEAFRSIHRLADARRGAEEAWGDIDVLVTPTTGTIYKIADVEWEPIRLNTNLGYYTNFVNFLDLAGVAVPAGFRDDGLPFGITLLGRAWTDEALLRLADRFHRVSVEHAGALGTALPVATGTPVTLARADALAVCRDERADPSQSRCAVRIWKDCRSITSSRVVARRSSDELAPLRRTSSTRCRAGRRFDRDWYASLRVGRPSTWRCGPSPPNSFGSFVAGIPAPLGIGKVDLEDGQQVSGFLCEAHAVEGARDITDLGGWRQYLRAR